MVGRGEMKIRGEMPCETRCESKETFVGKDHDGIGENGRAWPPFPLRVVSRDPRRGCDSRVAVARRV